MTRVLIGGSLGLVFGGPLGAIAGCAAMLVAPALRLGREPKTPRRLLLLILLVELRSGVSALAALQEVARSFPADSELTRVARLATVSGITSAIDHAGPELRPVVAQLARSQRSGGSLSATMRRLLEQDLAADRARRLARAKGLPVRLMIPITLLMLPGLVLLLYAPWVFRLFEGLTGAWS